MKEAAVGANRAGESSASRGFEAAEIATYLRRNADVLDAAKLPDTGAISVTAVAGQTASTLRELAIESTGTAARLEDLERRLTVLEEKLLAVLLAAVPDDEMVSVRADADRDLAPYCSKMPTPQ